MLHKIRGGLDIPFAGAPVPELRPGNAVASVAVLGADYPGLRADVVVAEGDRVQTGDTLFRDHKRPGICVTSPVCGTVATIEIGHKRQLTALVVTCGGSGTRAFDLPAELTRDAVQALCLESGLWPAFRERPFGHIPDPGTAPEAIFVTALETDPLAADATAILARARDAFAQGLEALAPLAGGPVFVCQGPGPAVATAEGQIRIERFAGRHPAGLPGTHIDRLFPVSTGRRVWQIHYQDVIALGTLRQTGAASGSRVVALAGPGIRDPRLLRVPHGAALDDLTRGELREGPMQVLSGSPLSGRESAYLRRQDWQVSVLPRRPPRPQRKAWLPRSRHPERPHAVVPTAALERALGPDLPVVPLIRALSTGDTETADRLGVSALLEEDMALLSYAAGNGQDFAALLRATLDRLEQDR